MRLSRKLQSVKPSATLALNARAKALAAKGVDVVGFAAGEPDFDTPDFIKEAAYEAIRTGFTKYTVTAGYPELRAAICEKLERENQLKYAPEQVLVSCGAKHSLYNIFQALLSPGDEVVILAPYWVSYPDMVKLADGIPVIVRTKEENGYAPDPAALRAALTSRTRALVINSPSNPTGGVLSRKALAAVAEVIRGTDVVVVTDDIYERLLYVDEPFANILNVAPDLAGQTVVVNGVSKAFAMTGWRLGYAAGPRELIAAMQMVQDQSTSNTASIVQKAAFAALKGPREPIDAMVREFKARRDLIVQGLNAIPGIQCRSPEGAFYVMPNVSSLVGRKHKGKVLNGSVDISDVLLDEYHVAAVPGLPFEAEGYIRMSFATSRQTIEKGLSRIRDFVAAVGG